MRINKAVVPIVSSMLFGCASPYVVPEGAAIAYVKSDIISGSSRHDSIGIFVSNEKCSRSKGDILFSILNSKSTPAGFVKIAANRTLQLRYLENAPGGDICHIPIQVKLEEGKHYSLVGGVDYKSGPIPILTGARICRFGVQDETKVAVPLEKCF